GVGNEWPSCALAWVPSWQLSSISDFFSVTSFKGLPEACAEAAVPVLCFYHCSGVRPVAHGFRPPHNSLAFEAPILFSLKYLSVHNSEFLWGRGKTST
ncbi:uncharacterized protein N7525_000977, partial [Penicillium rubens]|uniref:uncharacterized protein n=1 Tax=Penicillium rubens TaxID=1108849 RepID=UPI002A5AB297